jgi:hypothetical protein
MAAFSDSLTYSEKEALNFAIKLAKQTRAKIKGGKQADGDESFTVLSYSCETFV